LQELSALSHGLMASIGPVPHLTYHADVNAIGYNMLSSHTDVMQPKSA
jgi:hypothetical protein